MNIYELNFLMIILNALFFLLFFRRVRHSKKVFITIVTMQMVIINGFRNSSVGIDTLRYERHFNNIHNIDEVQSLVSYGSEIGYILGQKIISLLTNNFHIWLIFVAIMIFSILGIFIYKHSKSFFISYLLFLLLGFFDFSISGIRQSIALMIILCSYKFILEKKAFKFFLIVLLASSFHSSALIFLPMYFLANIKWNKFYMLVLMMVFSVVYIFRNFFGNLLTIIYYEEEADIILNTYESSQGIGGLTIFLLILLIIGVIIYNPFKYRTRENIVLPNIILIAFFIQSLSSFSYLFTRLNMYYLIFVIIYIPFLIDNVEKAPIRMDRKERKTVKAGLKLSIIIIVIIAYAVSLTNGLSPGLEPYKFFWE